MDLQDGKEVINKGSVERDLGVVIQDNLLAEKHINKITNNTYRMVISMSVFFHYMDEDMIKKLIMAMIRPKLEYAAVVWSQHLKKHIKKLERIQRVATETGSKFEGHVL